MNRKKTSILSSIMAVLVCIACAGCSSVGSTTAVDNNLRFTTGGESGTYYAFGTVLANWATNNSPTKVIALAGSGSQANIQALEDFDADLAFCQSDVEAYAYEGTNLFKNDGAYKDFSIVAALYQEQVQMVTCDPNIKSVSDLKGKTVSIGAANSGTYFNALDILGAYGLSESDINAVYQSFGDSTDSLKNGKIDAAFIVAGAPTTAITDLSTSKQAYLVSMDDEHIQKLCETSPYYASTTISKSAYGTSEDTKSVAVLAVIIANNYVTEDAIYNFTSSIFDGKEHNASAHAKYKELSLETASSITGIPYHPGAAKYYKEHGITVKTQ